MADGNVNRENPAVKSGEQEALDDVIHDIARNSLQNIYSFCEQT